MTSTTNVLPPTNTDSLNFRKVFNQNQPKEPTIGEIVGEVGQKIVNTSGNLASKKRVQATVISTELLTGGALIAGAVAVATLLSNPAFILLLITGLVVTGIGLSLLDIAVILQVAEFLSEKKPAPTKEVAELHTNDELFTLEDDEGFPEKTDDFYYLASLEKAAQLVEDGAKFLEDLNLPKSFDNFNVNVPFATGKTLLDFVEKESALDHELKNRGAVRFADLV